MPKSERTVQEWMTEIQQGLEYRNQYGFENGWGKIEKIFFNGHPSNATSGSNLIYSTGDAFLSEVNTPNPTFLANPTKIDQVPWAPCVESMSNDLVCQTRMKRAFARASLYSYLWGVSFLKIGFDSEFGWNPEYDAGGTKQPAGASLTRFGKNQFLLEYSDNRPGMPWIAPCKPHDIVVPWGTCELDEAPWVAHRVIRHIDDIKADIKYNSRELQPVMSMQDFVESYETVGKNYRIGPDMLDVSTEGSKDAEYCELWEIHDKKTHKIYVVATGHDKFLRNEVNHLQLRGLPFVELGFTPKARTIWRASDAFYILGHQAELADITIQARKQRRLNVLKFIMDSGAFTEAEERKLLSRDIGAVAKANSMGRPLGDVFFAVPQSNANMMLYQEAEDVRGAARETVGFDRNSYGEYRGARTTAREVAAVQDSKQNRLSRRQSLLGDAYIDAMQKMNAICFAFWTAPKVMEVVGMDGMMMWQTFVPRELAGQYNLELIFDDPPQESMASRQQMAMQAVQLSATDPTVDPIQARRFLARSYRNANVSSIFKPGILPGTVPQMGQGGGGQTAPGVQQGAGGRGNRVGAQVAQR